MVTNILYQLTRKVSILLPLFLSVIFTGSTILLNPSLLVEVTNFGAVKCYHIIRNSGICQSLGYRGCLIREYRIIQFYSSVGYYSSGIVITSELIQEYLLMFGIVTLFEAEANSVSPQIRFPHNFPRD